MDGSRTDRRSEAAELRRPADGRSSVGTPGDGGQRDTIDRGRFGRPDLAESVAEGDRVDVVASLASRTFGGFESLQLIVRDVAPSGSHPAGAAILAGGPLTVVVIPASAPADPVVPAARVAPLAGVAGGPDR